jgi:hypothetical protein
MTGPAAQARNVALRSDLVALATVFFLIVGFTFTDDIVEFLLDVTGHYHLAATHREWLVLGLDLVLVLATAALKWWISEDQLPPAEFLRRLLTGLWGVGALLVVGAHLALILTSEHRSELGDVASFWISMLASTVFVAAMAMLMLAVLSEKDASRGWIAPLVFGTFVVQIASALWHPVINSENACAGDISSAFFSDLTNLMSIVLLAVAVELNYVRRNANARDPGRRMAPVFTVLMLCIGLGLTVTMDVKADKETLCGTGAVWHEYISFVVNVQALAIGLATLVWLLLGDALGTEVADGEG